MAIVAANRRDVAMNERPTDNGNVDAGDGEGHFRGTRRYSILAADDLRGVWYQRVQPCATLDPVHLPPVKIRCTHAEHS